MNNRYVTIRTVIFKGCLARYDIENSQKMHNVNKSKFASLSYQILECDIRNTILYFEYYLSKIYNFYDRKKIPVTNKHNKHNKYTTLTIKYSFSFKKSVFKASIKDIEHRKISFFYENHSRFITISHSSTRSQKLFPVLCQNNANSCHLLIDIIFFAFGATLYFFTTAFFMNSKNYVQ